MVSAGDVQFKCAPTSSLPRGETTFQPSTVIALSSCRNGTPCPNAAVASSVSASRLRIFPLAHAMPDDVVRFIESAGGRDAWHVREFRPIDALNVAPPSLICESASTVRRLWTFPEDWRRLTDAELLALFDIA